jgi:hypothetical protein
MKLSFRQVALHYATDPKFGQILPGALQAFEAIERNGMTAAQSECANAAIERVVQKRAEE